MNKLSTDFANLTNIKSVIKDFSLTPNKSLGQHFLLDSNITDQMILRAHNIEGSTVIEVGPGPGILTRSILSSKAKKVIAIEFDSRFIKALGDLKTHSNNRLEIIQQDALSINWDKISGDKYAVISNLPYNISSSLLMKWLRQTNVSQIIVMIQKELAERFCAVPGDRSYGKISILAQSSWDIETMFEVGRNEFYPPPKVDSAVIKFAPKDKFLTSDDYDKLNKVCTIAFSNRRKVVKSALKQLFADPTQALAQVDAALNSRAEDLSLSQYLLLAKYLK